ncbi:MAG: T9SS type A sorting domain-containing protein [Candidatus Marinimicrobia bacterium]|jgi:hypothetical protein|nr:T9SS type A sorting domain-containing protein [Candidatus Neomarinimicrobiota bacterium]MBT3501679.1 T9SS type A sorting domain-containing protein [Candidatus Neomarinimicrobiota bacterium]MBT3839857.1 T9SS type A sorting domain-containing protein [Candidatus Neomarinimicrobiota bacterium]MBT3998445.1 T9SS type A sorting domain-containing protein [Candidatus Neomarinimicrobiota bacterium]MBT4282235.1 T9SS type A sorting domain-containing protein [Candidatus Neomarinimicrobiota bacterium]
MNKIIRISIYLSSALLFSQELFDPYEVHSLNIEFYNSNYDSILQAQWQAHDKSYELASLIFNGDTLDSVGVRYKGSSTYYYTLETNSPKFPLNIDLDLIYEDQELMGYNKIKLSSSIFDPTFVRETLGYLTTSYYLPTSQTGYMNVSINDELTGLYISVESVNKSFLSKHFGNNQGAFFKCEPQSQFGEDNWENPDLTWHGTDSTLDVYQLSYELKSDTGWDDLLDLIYTLNFEINQIENILNVDRVLWFFAASTVLPDLDTYNGFWIHNYYLYQNTISGQFEIIPWDKDHSFGGALVNFVDEVEEIYEWDPFIYENDVSRPLFSRLMSVPIYKKYFSAHIRTIVNDIYNANYIQSLAYGIQDSIETYAANDPNLFPFFGNGEYFQYNVDNFLLTGLGLDFCGIIPTVEARRSYLLSHNEIDKVTPVIANVIQSVDIPIAGEDVYITAEVTEGTLVELMWTISAVNTHFSFTEMFDDGAHEDGEAGDGNYGALIPNQEWGAVVKYYVRAQNDEALSLSPEFAEQDFYEFSLGNQTLSDSTLIINEINYNSSDNFDAGDWVELYNASSLLMDISEWRFKDEDDDHSFILPENTIIEPGEYLVLSKDSLSFTSFFPEVENFVGEIDFGFSGGGELLRLYDENGILVDSVRYDDSNPWPNGPDGNGPTLELINPYFDNAIADSWASSIGNGSPGTVNTSYLSKDKDAEIQATDYYLHQNYPNPFNPTTTIQYDLPEDSQVNIVIYNIKGREIKTLVNHQQNAGFKSVVWDATNDLGQPVSAGVYLYRISAGDSQSVKKMVLLK